MPKAALDAVMDAALDYVTANATALHICTAAETPGAPPAASVGSAAVTFGANEDAGAYPAGRRVQVNQIDDLSPSAGGDVDHLALVNAGGNVIYQTTTSTTTVQSGVPVDIASWFVTVQDPT